MLVQAYHVHALVVISDPRQSMSAAVTRTGIDVPQDDLATFSSTLLRCTQSSLASTASSKP